MAQIAQPLGGEQIQSGCKLCCRYLENTVETSVQIKTLKTLKSSLITVPNLHYSHCLRFPVEGGVCDMDVCSCQRLWFFSAHACFLLQLNRGCGGRRGVCAAGPGAG